jgi:branched-chain amino acid transport system permease protein
MSDGLEMTEAPEAPWAAETPHPEPRADRDWKLFAFKAVVVVVVAGVLYWLPTYYQSYRVQQFNEVIFLSIAVLGLGLLTGFNGQISLGHGAFFGIGAYTTAILVTDHGWSYLATFPVGALIAFVLGALVGVPALRIKGLYLALTTLAFATTFTLVIKRYSSITGGTQGKVVPRFQVPSWSNLERDQFTYYLFLIIAVVLFVLARNLVKSRVGRALIAVRDNEVAAEVVGVNLAAYKVMTFGLSAALAGIAGSMSVIHNPFVDANSFTINKSIEFLAALVIGGAATIFGPIIGAAFVVFVPEYSKDINPALSQVVYGGLLIVLMLVLPGGIMGGLKQLWAFAARHLPGSAPAAPSDPPPASSSADDAVLPAT